MAKDNAPPTGTLYWLQAILRDERLNPTETLLLVALADHVGADDRAWPSIATLARLARCSYGTARRHLTELESKGVVNRSQRRRPDGGKSTYEYHLRREFFGDPPLDLRGPSAHPDARTLRAPSARAEVPNEPSNELAATPRADCARGCVDGWMTREAEAGYSFLTPCECNPQEQSA